MERETVHGDGCGCYAGAVIVVDVFRGEFVGVVRVACTVFLVSVEVLPWLWFCRCGR